MKILYPAYENHNRMEAIYDYLYYVNSDDLDPPCRTHTRETWSILVCYYVHLNQFLSQNSVYHESYFRLNLMFYTICGVTANINTLDGYH